MKDINMTYEQVKQHLNWNTPNRYDYSVNLYYDPKSDNANAYISINLSESRFQFAFDGVSEGECHSKYVKYQDRFVEGISAILFIPNNKETNNWQIDFYHHSDGSMDTIQFPRTDRLKKGLQGTTETLHINDIL